MVRWEEETDSCILTELTFDTLSDNAREQLTKWGKCQAPVDRTNWHIYFILQAYLVSTRSLDAQTKCGCIITRDNAIIGTGYNSFIRNINDNKLPNLRPEKYPFMIHSEHNAILNCARNGIACNGAKAYITGPPCCACLQYMYQAGITDIYFANYNKAHMTMNEEYDTQFEILANLMQRVRIFCLNLDKETVAKIEAIKGC